MVEDENMWESDSSNLSVDLDALNFTFNDNRNQANPPVGHIRREKISVSNAEEDHIYRDMTCSVCYRSMAELAEQERKKKTNSKGANNPSQRLGVAN